MPTSPDAAIPAPHPTPDSADAFRANLDAVRARIDAAAHQAGREPSEIRLLPVSKTVPSERLRLAVEAGMTELGENKVQEVSRKAQELSDLDLHWAVIGPLQTNKARDVARYAHEFQALDRIKVAEALERRLEAEDRTLDVYVQVNTSAEEAKSGLNPDELPEFLATLPQFSRLRVRGLMTLAVHSEDVEQVRGCFQLLRQLRDDAREATPELIGPGELSMGMSGDFELAIAEGANVVRVGQAIFGARPAPAMQE